jgi:hypothetical protein
VREDRADQQRVQAIETAFERVLERGQLLAQPALGQVGQNLGVGRAGNERVEHRATRDPEDVRRDAVQLDVGVLQRLVQPVGLALALSDLRLAIPGKQAQRPHRLGRHEAALQQAGLGQLTQPLRVADVRLAARYLLDVAGVDQQQLEVVFEDVPDRLPVHARGLHHDLRNAMGRQPITQRQQPTDRRLKLRHKRHADPALIGDAHARHDRRLVHIQGRRTLHDHVHPAPLLRRDEHQRAAGRDPEDHRF